MSFRVLENLLLHEGSGSKEYTNQIKVILNYDDGRLFLVAGRQVGSHA